MKRLSILLCICILFSCVGCNIPKQSGKETTVLTEPSDTPRKPDRFFGKSFGTLADYEAWVAQADLPEDFLPYEQLSFIGDFRALGAFFENINGEVKTRECIYEFTMDSKTAIMLQVQSIEDEKDPTEPLLSMSWGTTSTHPRILWNTSIDGHEGDDLRRFENWQSSSYGEDSREEITVDYYGARYRYYDGGVCEIVWESYGKVFVLTQMYYDCFDKIAESSDNVLSNFFSKSTAPYAVHLFEEMVRANAPEGITQPDSYYYFSLPGRDYLNSSGNPRHPINVVLQVSYIGGDVKAPEISPENTGTPSGEYTGFGVSDVMDYEGVRFDFTSGFLHEILWVSNGKIYSLQPLGNSTPPGYSNIDWMGLAYLDPEAETPFKKFLTTATVGEGIAYFEQYLQTLHPKS